MSNDTEVPVEGLEEFVNDFLHKRKQELLQLSTFISDKNFAEIRHLTHRWKGFSAPYGFGTLGTLAEELNNQAHKQDVDACQSIYKQMQTYLAKKEKEILG